MNQNIAKDSLNFHQYFLAVDCAVAVVSLKLFVIIINFEPED